MKKLFKKLTTIFKQKPTPEPEPELFVYESTDEEGKVSRVFINKKTRETWIDAGALAHNRGFKDQHEFLASDEGLDMIAAAAKRSENPLLTITEKELLELKEKSFKKKPTE